MSAQAARVVQVGSRPALPKALSAGLRALSRSRAATLGSIVLGVTVLAATFAPLLAPRPYDAQDFSVALLPPLASMGHPLGTDQFGRDIWSRILYGARISLAVSSFGMVIAALVGVSRGCSSPYSAGRFAAVSLRVPTVHTTSHHL